MKRITNIAYDLEKALIELEIDPALKGAIMVMKVCPHKIFEIKCFVQALWELIEDCMNSKILLALEEERQEYFIAACTLLENIEEKKTF